MERYSKEYSSKWQSKYSEEFKRFVCNDYLTGSLTRREVEVKHRLENLKWICLHQFYNRCLF